MIIRDFEWGLTVERLREVLVYDPITGLWRWLKMLSWRRAVGSSAGECKKSGYVLIGIDGHRYRAHRLAWLYMTGAWPSGELDHKDTNPSNNRWNNIREATRVQNTHNTSLSKSNTSGFKGAYWHKKSGKWMAHIKYNCKTIYLGLFDTREEAHAAYVAKAIEFLGEFARAA